VNARQASINYTVSLSHLPATPQQRRVVFLVAMLLLVGSGIAAPFGDIQLGQYPGAIVAQQAIVLVNDFITSLFLFAQYSIVRSRGLLALAGGYLLTALIVIPHALTFPGAFSSTGLLNAGLQSTAWLYIFWHIGAASGILAYAILRDTGRAEERKPGGVGTAIAGCVLVAIGLTVGLTWLATAGERFLPTVFADRVDTFPMRLKIVAGLMFLSAAIPFAVLWARRRSVLDYWLMLVAWTLMLEEALIGFVTSSRYSVGFYTGRALLLVTSIIVLSLFLEEMMRLYARIAGTNIKLERERDNKLMSLEAVASAIVHEVKQPATAVVLNGVTAQELLQQTPPDMEEAQSALDDIVNDGRRLGQVLDNIMELFGRQKHRQEIVDLAEVVITTLRTVRGELSDRSVRTDVEFAAELPPIIGSKAQLQEVVLNLINNAIEAMANINDDRRVLKVRTRLDGGKSIVLEIEDSGHGIGPERLHSVFDPFVTTKSHGMGLGLPICRAIVEPHAGQLVCSSDGKSGALFKVVLPIGTDARAQAAPD
jgi:signal transduction histidine kinase